MAVLGFWCGWVLFVVLCCVWLALCLCGVFFVGDAVVWLFVWFDCRVVGRVLCGLVGVFCLVLVVGVFFCCCSVVVWLGLCGFLGVCSVSCLVLLGLLVGWVFGFLVGLVFGFFVVLGFCLCLFFFWFVGCLCVWVLVSVSLLWFLCALGFLFPVGFWFVEGFGVWFVCWGVVVCCCFWLFGRFLVVLLCLFVWVVVVVCFFLFLFVCFFLFCLLFGFVGLLFFCCGGLFFLVSGACFFLWWFGVCVCDFGFCECWFGVFSGDLMFVCLGLGGVVGGVVGCVGLGVLLLVVG